MIMRHLYMSQAALLLQETVCQEINFCVVHIVNEWWCYELNFLQTILCSSLPEKNFFIVCFYNFFISTAWEDKEGARTSRWIGSLRTALTMNWLLRSGSECEKNTYARRNTVKTSTHISSFACEFFFLGSLFQQCLTDSRNNFYRSIK